MAVAAQVGGGEGGESGSKNIMTDTLLILPPASLPTVSHNLLTSEHVFLTMVETVQIGLKKVYS